MFFFEMTIVAYHSNLQYELSSVFNNFIYDVISYNKICIFYTENLYKLENSCFLKCCG